MLCSVLTGGHNEGFTLKAVNYMWDGFQNKRTDE